MEYEMEWIVEGHPTFSGSERPFVIVRGAEDNGASIRCRLQEAPDDVVQQVIEHMPYGYDLKDGQMCRCASGAWVFILSCHRSPKEDISLCQLMLDRISGKGNSSIIKSKRGKQYVLSVHVAGKPIVETSHEHLSNASALLLASTCEALAQVVARQLSLRVHVTRIDRRIASN